MQLRILHANHSVYYSSRKSQTELHYQSLGRETTPPSRAFCINFSPVEQEYCVPADFTLVETNIAEDTFRGWEGLSEIAFVFAARKSVIDINSTLLDYKNLQRTTLIPAMATYTHAHIILTKNVDPADSTLPASKYPHCPHCAETTPPTKLLT